MKGADSNESVVFLKANVRISNKPGALHAVISTLSGRSTSIASSNLNSSYPNRNFGNSFINKSAVYGTARPTGNKSILAQSNFIPAHRIPTSPSLPRDRN